MEEEDLICPSFGQSDVELYQSASFCIGIGTCAVSFVGIFANVTSSYVLSRKEMRNTFNQLLVALAGIDSGFLLLMFLDSYRKTVHPDTLFHQGIVIAFPYFVYPFKTIFLGCSTYLTIGISLERYFAVKDPIDHRQSTRGQKWRHCRYLAAAVALALLINVPKFFEARLVWAETKYVMTTTDLRRDADYVFYYQTWFRSLASVVLPFFLLAGVNLKIYFILKRHNDKYARGVLQHNDDAEHVRRQENRMALVLAGIVAIFLLCHALRVVLSLHEMLTIKGALKCLAAHRPAFPLWAIICAIFEELLLALNSSVNIVLYIFLNKTFRRLLFSQCTRIPEQESGANRHTLSPDDATRL